MKKSPRFKASSSLEITGLLDAEMAKMNVGDLSEEDKESLVLEISKDPKTVEVGPSFVSVLIGDILTFTIFATAIYMVVIQYMNGITEALLK